MRRDEKTDIINSLADTLKEYSHFYLTDTAQLNAADTSDLRRKCFENQIRLVVVKNTLLKRALEQAGLECGELFPVLKGSTAVMFSNNGNTPAKMIRDFRKSHPKPLIKGAYIEESVYVGDNLLETLVALKSREELTRRYHHASAVAREERYLRAAVRWFNNSRCSGNTVKEVIIIS